MVIRGNSRGNPKQMSHYLLDMRDNEAIRILDVDGRIDPQPEHLHDAVFAMGISAELSKGDKGLYHAQINPAPGEDKLMDDDRWERAADMLAKELGLENQRRVIVLHTKKDRTHAHVVWERFDNEKQKLVSDSFSRLAQDRARKEMEREFGQQPTPHRNKHRPELKAAMTQAWEKTMTGKDFVQDAKDQGYTIAAGSGRDPFTVVDENGRSYNLNRQIKGVRLKDIRARLRDEKLIGEKEAISQARSAKNSAEQEREGRGKQQAKPSQPAPSYSVSISYTTRKEVPGPEKEREATKEKRTDNSRDVPDKEQTAQQRAKDTAKGFAASRDDITPRPDGPGQEKPGPAQQKAKETARDFAASRNDMASGPEKPDLSKQQKDNRGDITGQQPDKSKQEEFQENMTSEEKKAARLARYEKGIAEARQRMAEREKQQQRDRDQGIERD